VRDVFGAVAPASFAGVTGQIFAMCMYARVGSIEHLDTGGVAARALIEGHDSSALRQLASYGRYEDTDARFGLLQRIQLEFFPQIPQDNTSIRLLLAEYWISCLIADREHARGALTAIEVGVVNPLWDSPLSDRYLLFSGLSSATAQEVPDWSVAAFDLAKDYIAVHGLFGKPVAVHAIPSDIQYLEYSPGE
jgi:hypothetical protein